MRTAISFASKPQYHGPIGKCIYCGSDGPNGGLSKEHAVPAALEGSHVIRAASCETCRIATKEIEKINFQGANSNFGVFLLQDGFQGRNHKKKPRPTHLPITVAAKTHTAHRMVPIKDRPPALFLPELGEPGILIGREIGAAYQQRLKILHDDNAAVEARHGGAVTVGANFNGNAFMQLLAKMAHCMAVITYGIEGFDPLLPDLILGKNPGLAGYLIGQSKAYPAIPAIEVKPQQRRHTIYFRTDLNRRLVVAGIQLFSRYPTQTYCVVTGKVTAAQLARRGLAALPSI